MDKTNFQELLDTLTQVEPVAGIMPADVLAYPAPIAGMVRKIIRKQQITLTEFAALLDMSVDETKQVIALLIEKGMLVDANHADLQPKAFSRRSRPPRQRSSEGSEDARPTRRRPIRASGDVLDALADESKPRRQRRRVADPLAELTSNDASAESEPKSTPVVEDAPSMNADEPTYQVRFAQMRKRKLAIDF
ncbi:MAG: hypothetical protein AAF639_17570 [Chloroflexota bacterium]